MSRVITVPPTADRSGALSPDRTHPAWEAPVKALIVVAAGVLLVLSLQSRGFWTTPLSWSRHTLEIPFFVIATMWGAVWYAALAWRVTLWWRYRPMADVPRRRLPSLSVIIPAFNEGALVRSSIRSVAASRYPTDRLQIIVIDDGSTDDTWDHIQAAVCGVENRVSIQTVRQPKNLGKRHALYEGFQRATGDVIVTIDSDSVVEPETLRRAVAPLVHDAKIGAVAGCVNVMNPNESLITRFLKCTFSLSFKFVRAYQSGFRGVFCTPGALSVYRASIVHKVADEWLNQHFLGLPCSTGEDRAMTNLILREGWQTFYQGNARVWSRMPTDYRGMTQMFLRWARSNIRETVVLHRFLLRPFRTEHLWSFRLNMYLVLVTLIVPYFLIWTSWSLTLTNSAYALRHSGMVVLYALTVAFIYYRNERDSDWIWLLVYEFFWIFCLSWIMPFALLTLRNTGWLTRGAAQPAPAAAPHSTLLVAKVAPQPGPLVGALKSAPVATSGSVTQAA
jgi:hyaluronan synthase